MRSRKKVANLLRRLRCHSFTSLRVHVCSRFTRVLGLEVGRRRHSHAGTSWPLALRLCNSEISINFRVASELLFQLFPESLQAKFFGLFSDTRTVHKRDKMAKGNK